MADEQDRGVTLAEAGVVVRELTGRDELVAACRVYRTTFSLEGPDEGLNPRLLQGLRDHSGSVVGAVHPGRGVVAMAYGWTAVETDPADPHVYHYSQSAAVEPDLQGLGVGRALKQVQRDVAVRRGASRMRWTYDPLLSRNAHFNLDVLGARGRWLRLDLYGVPGSHRITVEWDLDRPDGGPGPDPSPLPELSPGDMVADGGATYLAVPARRPGDEEPLAVALRRWLVEVFDRGLVATSCRRTAEDVAVYRFEEPSHVR